VNALLAGAASGLGVWAVAAVLRLGDRRAAGLVGRSWRPRPEPPAWFVAALSDALVPVDHRDAWFVALVGPPLLGVAGFVTGGIGIATAALLLSAGGPALAVAARRGRAARAVDAALPETLEAAARSLRTGASLRQALDEAAPEVVARAGAGESLTACLDRWADRCPTPGVRLAVASLALAAEAGGTAAAAVDGVAATIRADLAVAAEVRAQSSQARLSALVIAVSPLVFGLLAAGTDGRTAQFLLRTPLGSLCLLAGLVLDAVAAWWMHRITVTPC